MSDFNSNMVNKTIKDELKRVVIPLNDFLSLNESIKDISDCSSSEKYLIRSILKTEVGIISTKTYYQTTILLKQVNYFSFLIEEYLYHTSIHSKTELDNLFGSFRTLYESFCLSEDIPYVNKQHELFDNTCEDLEFDLIVGD